MFKIKCWYSPWGAEIKNTAEKIAIRCSNCGNETIIDVDNLNTTYQDIITTFVLNTMLQNVGMLWIIETNEQLKYDMDKNNSEWMTGGPWYNKYICKKLHENLFEGFIRNTRTDRYNIMCFIDSQKKEHQNLVMISEAVGFIHYHKIQQQKHWFCSVQP